MDNKKGQNIKQLNTQLGKDLFSPFPKLNKAENLSSPLPSLNLLCFCHGLHSVCPKSFGEVTGSEGGWGWFCHSFLLFNSFFSATAWIAYRQQYLSGVPALAWIKDSIILIILSSALLLQNLFIFVYMWNGSVGRWVWWLISSVRLRTSPTLV